MCVSRKLIYISCQAKRILIYSISKPKINKKILSDHRNYTYYSDNQKTNRRQTRVRSKVFLSIVQQPFNLRICLFYTFSIKMYVPTKQYLRKRQKIMYNG